MTSRTALANTVEMSPSELSDYRYHETRLTPCVYTFGNTYVCASKRQPTFRGDYENLNFLAWQHHPDQFWAEKAGTVIWFAESQGGVS